MDGGLATRRCMDLDRGLVGCRPAIVSRLNSLAEDLRLRLLSEAPLHGRLRVVVTLKLLLLMPIVLHLNWLLLRVVLLGRGLVCWVVRLLRGI